MSIKNKKQYQFTKSRIAQFSQSLSQLQCVDTIQFTEHELVLYQFYIDSINSTLNTLQQELNHYENTKSRISYCLSLPKRFLGWVRSHLI